MQGDSIFDCFDNGVFIRPNEKRDFSLLPWNEHPKFKGVFLKHLLTSKETNGAFSYHLVRIEPGMQIGEHTHDPQLETHEVIAGRGHCQNGEVGIDYEPGVISIFPPTIKHEVTASDTGLKLFAKFMRPLC